VFFRKFTVAKAQALHLVGWCANTQRGTVVGECQGKPQALEEMKVCKQLLLLDKAGILARAAVPAAVSVPHGTVTLVPVQSSRARDLHHVLMCGYLCQCTGACWLCSVPDMLPALYCLALRRGGFAQGN
jgi:acylphosphatase